MAAALSLDVATTQVRLRVNKGEDFVLTIPVYDSTVPTPILVSLVGYTAVATVVGPGATPQTLFTWSTTAGNLVCDAGGAHLTFDSAVTSLWTFDDGEFELDIISGSGARGIPAAGPFTAVPRQGTPL